MYGVAGTGKTFLGMYFGLSELFVGNCRQVIIIRSAVASRDLGFLPGTLSEKMTVYEAPYKDLCSELCGGRRDVYDALKKKGNLDFMSTSFIRGLTFDEAIVIVDEVQNLTDHELNSVLTRIGKNCRVLLCGDFRQDDLKMTGKKSHETGIHNMIRIAQVMPSFDLVEFQIDDIVRSGFVKEYIVARLKLKMD
jgi:phosphate starvation-inducible protein PhoH